MTVGNALRWVALACVVVFGATSLPRWRLAADAITTAQAARGAADAADLPRAARLLEAASSRNPRDPGLAATAGAAARSWAVWGGGADAYESAARLLARGVAQDPADSAGLALLADAQAALGRPELAHEALSAALRLDPNNAAYRDRSAELLDKLGFAREADEQRAAAKRLRGGR